MSDIKFFLFSRWYIKEAPRVRAARPAWHSGRTRLTFKQAPLPKEHEYGLHGVDRFEVVAHVMRNDPKTVHVTGYYVFADVPDPGTASDTRFHPDGRPCTAYRASLLP